MVQVLCNYNKSTFEIASIYILVLKCSFDKKKLYRHTRSYRGLKMDYVKKVPLGLTVLVSIVPAASYET